MNTHQITALTAYATFAVLSKAIPNGIKITNIAYIQKAKI
jgi:hypothetical protein